MLWLKTRLLGGCATVCRYRNSNYQSKDIAHVQKQIAQRMADKVRAAPAALLQAENASGSWRPCYGSLP